MDGEEKKEGATETWTDFRNDWTGLAGKNKEFVP